MSKFKFVMQLVLSFVIAVFAFNFAYLPFQDQAKALARKNIVPVLGKEEQPIKAGELRISMLDVGHGDAILLQTKDKNVLVDVGSKKNSEKVEAGLAKNGVKKIDTIIVTHHHQDHMGNILNFAGKYSVKRIFDNGMANPDNPVSLKLNSLLSKGYYNNRTLKSGDIVYLDKGYYLEILAPGDYLDENLYKIRHNNTSIVAQLHFGNFTMMLSGDTESVIEIAMAEKYGNKLKSDVLKVAHHGSRTSSNWNFISKVKPEYALISCSSYEDMKHPNKNVVKSLEHLGAKVLTTHKNGELKVITDGSSFRVENEK